MSRSRMNDGCSAPTYRQQLLAAMKFFLTTSLFTGGKGLRRWTLRSLTFAAILMAWSETPGLVDRFASVRETLDALWPSRRRSGRTYQGFVKALVRWSPRLLRRLESCLRTRVRETAGASWETFGWVMMGVDGSKFELARTEANEGAFGCSGRGEGAPHIWLTTVLHLATGLPWCWKIGRANASERDHLRVMQWLLPQNTMLVADAGYTGYELWRELIDSGRSVLIRVGSNVQLLRKLGYAVCEDDGTVYLWPADQRRDCQPPLVLRLIWLHDGRKPVCLITNVLDPSELSDHQAGSIYRMRWGLELWFRALKQTLGRRQMRSGAPVRAALELRWTVAGWSLLGLWAAKAIVDAGEDASRMSPAAALRCVRSAMAQPHRRPRRNLWGQLSRAVKDRYVRRAAKTARAWPHKKTERPPRPPKIRDAHPSEVQAAQRLKATPQAA